MNDRSSSVRPDAPPMASMAGDLTMMEAVAALMGWLPIGMRLGYEPAVNVSRDMIAAILRVYDPFDIAWAMTNIRLALALELWDHGVLDPEKVQEVFNIRPGRWVLPFLSRAELLRSPDPCDHEIAATGVSEKQVVNAMVDAVNLANLFAWDVCPHDPGHAPSFAVEYVLMHVAERLGVSAPVATFNEGHFDRYGVH